MEPLKDPTGTQQSVNHHLPTNFFWNIETELLGQSGSSWLWTQLPIAPAMIFLRSARAPLAQGTHMGLQNLQTTSSLSTLGTPVPRRCWGREGSDFETTPWTLNLYLALITLSSPLGHADSSYKNWPFIDFNPLGSSSFLMSSNFILSTHFFFY